MLLPRKDVNFICLVKDPTSRLTTLGGFRDTHLSAPASLARCRVTILTPGTQTIYTVSLCGEAVPGSSIDGEAGWRYKTWAIRSNLHLPAGTSITTFGDN